MSQPVVISSKRMRLMLTLLTSGTLLMCTPLLIPFTSPSQEKIFTLAMAILWPAIALWILLKLRFIRLQSNPVFDHELEIIEGNEENRNTFSINKDFRYLHFSPKHAKALQKFFGKSPRLFHSIFEFLPDNLHLDLRQNLEKSLAGRYIFIRRKIEENYFELTMSPMYDSSSEVSGVSCHYEDITQKIAIDQQLENYHEDLEKAIEERTAALQEQRDFFQIVLDSIANLIFVRDDQGKYVLVNKSAAESFPGQEGGMIGKTAMETHPSKQRARLFMMEDREIIKTGNPVITESISNWAYGDQKHFYLTKTRLDVKGRKYVLGIHTDITDLKRQESALIESNEELKQALLKLRKAQDSLVESEKLASLGQLTAGLAHEINNPINYVAGNVKPLLQDFEDIDKILKKTKELHHELKKSMVSRELLDLMEELDVDELIPETRKLLNGIADGTKRVKELMNSLKNLSRQNENSSTKFDLNKIINSTIALVKPSVSGEIKIKTELAIIPEVWGSPGEISQVLLNIIDNAIFAMAGGGHLKITSEVKAGNVIVKLCDTGKGIPADDLKKIFEPFYTTKEPGKGTGLGLAISHQIINKHEGHIEVESEPGHGTAFKITLPIREI